MSSAPIGLGIFLHSPGNNGDMDVPTYSLHLNGEPVSASFTLTPEAARELHRMLTEALAYSETP
jgi:hypothetical protein